MADIFTFRLGDALEAGGVGTGVAAALALAASSSNAEPLPPINWQALMASSACPTSTKLGALGGGPGIFHFPSKAGMSAVFTPLSALGFVVGFPPTSSRKDPAAVATSEGSPSNSAHFSTSASVVIAVRSASVGSTDAMADWYSDAAWQGYFFMRGVALWQDAPDEATQQAEDGA